jgi:hypothetical protein
LKLGWPKWTSKIQKKNQNAKITPQKHPKGQKTKIDYINNGALN